MVPLVGGIVGLAVACMVTAFILPPTLPSAVYTLVGFVGAVVGMLASIRIVDWWEGY